MKVTLVRYHDKGNINTRLPSSLNKVRGVLPPLGLAYIASYLEKKGCKVTIIDAIADNLTAEEFKNKLTGIAPEIVGITTMTSTFFGALEAAKIAKEIGAIVVLGGPHISAFPEETFSYSYVDYCVFGDGEIPMAELIDSLENKKTVNTIKGLIYRNSGKIINNGPFVMMDINSLPGPAYHLLPLNKYTSIISSEHMATMVSARGCPYRCGYCFSQPTDKFYRTISPSKVVDQMEALIKDYEIKEIMFYDDSIAVKRQHIEGICNEIINRKLKIRWESPCRVDNVDFDLLKLMKTSGCFRLRFGVESGNSNILQLMNKRISLEQAENVFRWCKELSIETFSYFIIGYVNETDETMKDTINFAKKLDSDFAMFTVATPYPFTELLDLSVKKGLVNADYWRNFVLGKEKRRIPYLVEDSEAWLKKAYKKYYLRPSYILKKISRIRTVGDIKRMFDAAKGILYFEA